MEENLNNRFDYRHKNVKIMIILDFITLVCVILYSALAPKKLNEIAVYYYKESHYELDLTTPLLVVYGLTLALFILTLGICLFFRFKLLTEKKKKQAFILQIVCGILGLHVLEIINGLIIYYSKLYPDMEDQVFKPLDWYKETLEELKVKFENKEITPEDYYYHTEQYKKEIAQIKEKLEEGLSLLQVKTIKNGITKEDEKDLEDYNSKLLLCEELLASKKEQEIEEEIKEQE